MKRLLVWVLCLLLTGCGGKQPADWSAFIPKEEERLVIYTSHPRSVYEPVIKEFEERTGLWVQVETGGTAELLESLEEDLLEEMEEELNKAAKALDAQIKAKEREYAAQVANVPSESGYLWPLPGGYNTISSLAGGRIHPVTGKPGNHAGINFVVVNQNQTGKAGSVR